MGKAYQRTRFKDFKPEPLGHRHMKLACIEAHDGWRPRARDRKRHWDYWDCQPRRINLGLNNPKLWCLYQTIWWPREYPDRPWPNGSRLSKKQVTTHDS
jgi:hypothetical protein